MAEPFAQRVIPMLSYGDAGGAAELIAEPSVSARPGGTEDLEGRRWMFASPGG